MKIDFIADTNFLIYLHEGNKIVQPFIEYNFGISFITEVELLGFHKLTKIEESKLKLLISDCFLIDWNEKIKKRTIQIKQNHTIKLPDAIIAATCFPLVGVPPPTKLNPLWSIQLTVLLQCAFTSTNFS